MPSSAVAATGGEPAQGSGAACAEVAEVVTPARGNVLGAAAAKPATMHTAKSDSPAPPAAVEGTARHAGVSSQRAAVGAPRLLSPADMVAALSTEPRATRLERSHAVLELAASPANRRRLAQRRSAATAVAASAPAPPAEQAPVAGSRSALASTGMLEPAAAATDAGKDRAPASQPARAPEPADTRQVSSAVSARPTAPLGPAAEPGQSLAGSARPARRQHDTAPSLQQPEALGAAAPRSQDGRAFAAAFANDGTAPAVRHAPQAEATAHRQPSSSVREVITRGRVFVEAASATDVISDPTAAEQRGISDPPVAANKTVDDSCLAGLPDCGRLQPPVPRPVAAPPAAAVRPALAAADAAKVNALLST